MKFSLSIFIFIFSFPLISAPDNFSLACDEFRGKVDGKSIKIGYSRDTLENREKGKGICFPHENCILHGDARIKKFIFNYINDPSDSKIPRIDLFAKIPRNPIKETTWIKKSFNYAESSNDRHYFGIKEAGLPYELIVHRQSLGVSIYRSPGAGITFGSFDSCNLIDSKKVDEIRKSILIDKKNDIEEIEEEEKRIKEAIKSSQKI